MRTFLFVAMLFFSTGIFCQKDKTDGHILWSADRKLTWDDFQGKPRKNHFASAMSDVTFSVKIESEGRKLMVLVRPSFNPKGSWVNKEESSDFLLQHEQVHFDIYEVNARKLREELKTKKLTSVNAEGTISKLIEKYSELNIKLQERYDEETEHSIHVEKQEKWNEKIAAELESLSDYSDAEFEVIMEK